MPDSFSLTEPLALLDDFPPVPTEAWEAAIRADLKGADYEKKLVWKTEDGIRVKPYYRREDLPSPSPDPGRFPCPRGAVEPWEIATEIPTHENAIRADRFHEAGATAVQELAWSISQGVDRLASAGVPLPLTFVYAVGSNFFLEIAKLRAARQLWIRVVEQFNAQFAPAARIRVHAVTSLANKSIYDPYTNLLRATTEALSAILGCADAVTVREARFSSRLARNIQLILREEAHLDKVADPAGGSYYIEALTEALAREAWTLFQQIEGQGGFASAEASGAIAAALAASRAAKEQAVASRRRTLVGVNNYPNPAERALPDQDSLDPSAWRLARPFEAIRLRTERHAAATGRTPQVLLLTRGDLKMRMARATFCRNFFGCAGFDILESASLEGLAPDLVVLCSSDPEYPALVGEIRPLTTAPLIVAGYPKELVESIQAAGADGFVHVLSNAVETLSYWQDRLAMTA
jgi:methylmalonyl-CoA mutase